MSINRYHYQPSCWQLESWKRRKTRPDPDSAVAASDGCLRKNAPPRGSHFGHPSHSEIEIYGKKGAI